MAGLADVAADLVARLDDEQLADGEERYRQLGPYQLDEAIGSGAMGRVYRARRADGAFEREVAIKIQRWELADEHMERRFEHERQILADLDHPSIARLLDGGVTDDGVPYLVMELVEGAPIDEHCRRTRAPIARRLELVAEVLDAVQTAHGRLVIHRDIKPSNVLVDDDGRAKLLDFGVAKLLEPSRDPRLTRGTRGPFTYRYASPEQLRGEPLGVATDVYSLGLLLYELLTDRRPFDQVEEHLPDPRIAGTLPPPPSTVRALPTELDGLSRDAWRDLDAIVLAALAPDIDRRYRTVADLAADLRRFRDGHPVAARAPSPLYRARLLVRRNATTSALVALVVLTLIAATVVSSRQARRAEAEKRQAEQLAGHVLDILRLADPRAGGSTTLTARELLESSAAGLDQIDDPDTRARLQAVLGEGLVHLEVFDPAVDLLLAATRQRGYPRTIDDTTADLLMMTATAEAGRGDLPTALAHLDAVIAHREATATNPQARIALARALHHRAYLMARYTTPSASDRGAVRLQLERAIELLRAAQTGDHEPLANSLHLLGQEVFAQARAANGGPDEAATRRGLAIMTEAAAMRRRLDAGGHTANLVESLNDLALAHDTIGEVDIAITLLAEALDRAETHLSAGHPDTLMMRSNLASFYRDRGDLDEAAEHYEGALDGWRAAGLEPAAQPLYGLGLVRARQDRPTDAEPLLRRALARTDPSQPPYWIIAPLLGDVLRQLGQVDEAEPLLRRAVERTEELFGTESASYQQAVQALEALDANAGIEPRQNSHSEPSR